MARDIRILGRGLFEKKFMDTRITARAVTAKEKALGHLLGPLGMIMVINTMYALVELFFTEQVPLDTLYGKGTYLRMTMASRVLGTALGLFMGWVYQHTRSRQGRFRPWGLMGGLVTLVSGALLFALPRAFDRRYLVAVYAVYLAHNVAGITVYNAYSGSIVALSTRDFSQRTSIQYFRKLALTLISGILIGLVLTSVVYYSWLIHNRGAWETLMLGVCACALPLLFVEYFYTRERVMEDTAQKSGDPGVKMPLKAQLKALITNKYYLLMLVGTTLAGIAGAMKGGNVTTNFCRWVLGANDRNQIQMIYTIATGVPLGLGAIIAYPLAKKMGVRNMSMLGFGMVAAGSLLGLCFRESTVIAYVAGFIRQMGLIADCYVFPALLSGVGDMVEHKSGFRPEGLLSATILALVFGLFTLPFTGAYETVLLARGFHAALSVQPQAVKNWVSFAFYGFDLLLGLGWVCILPFMDIEARMPRVNADLLARREQAAQNGGEAGENDARERSDTP